jgi:hypothetical protein
MKTVVLDRVDGQPRFHAKMLDFANYYGFVPRVCHPYRPQTKGKIESTIRYIKGSFWPGLSFDSLQELNRQALAWCGEVSTEVRATIICGSDGYGKLARPIRAPEGGPASSDQPRSTPESREPVKGILVLLAGFLAIPGSTLQWYIAQQQDRSSLVFHFWSLRNNSERIPLSIASIIFGTPGSMSSPAYAR